MGWLGLVGLISIFGTFIALGFSAIRKSAEGFDSDYIIGFTVSMLMVTIHAYFEWITLLWVVEVIFAMNAGLFIALRDRVLRERSAPVAAGNWIPNPGTTTAASLST